SAEGDAAQAISIAFLYRDREIDTFTASPEGPDSEATAGIANLSLWVLYYGFVVALGLIGVADTLCIFLKLGSVVGLGEEVLKNEGVRNTYGPQVSHGGAQLAAGNLMIVLKFDFADFYFRSLFDGKVNGDTGRWDLPHLRTDSGELASVLGEQLF